MVALAGCSGRGGPERASVSGSVTLDGQPVTDGLITLYPAGGTNGPSVGGSIQDGRYSIAAAKGPYLGRYRVEINWPRKTGK